MTETNYHPDVAKFFALANATNATPWAGMDIEAARSRYRAATARFGFPISEVREVRDVDLAIGDDSVSCRLYRGVEADFSTRPQPAIVYFHGGGWVLGDLETHDGICRALANAATCSVIAVDYRRAPECQFPAAADDAILAVAAVAHHARDLGIDPARLSVAGDSAGATLALVAALGNVDLPAQLSSQVIFYPASDLSSTTPSYALATARETLTGEDMMWFIDTYVDVRDRQSWKASPLGAPNLSSSPPTFLLTLEHDPLRDEGIAYAERLARENVEIEFHHLPGYTHGLLSTALVVPEAEAMIHRAVQFVRAHW